MAKRKLFAVLIITALAIWGGGLMFAYHLSHRDPYRCVVVEVPREPHAARVRLYLPRNWEVNKFEPESRPSACELVLFTHRNTSPTLIDIVLGRPLKKQSGIVNYLYIPNRENKPLRECARPWTSLWGAESKKFSTRRIIDEKEYPLKGRIRRLTHSADIRPNSVLRCCYIQKAGEPGVYGLVYIGSKEEFRDNKAAVTAILDRFTLE